MKKRRGGDATSTTIHGENSDYKVAETPPKMYNGSFNYKGLFKSERKESFCLSFGKNFYVTIREENMSRNITKVSEKSHLQALHPSV